MDEMVGGAWEKKKNAVLVWKPERKNHMEDLSLEFRLIVRRTSRQYGVRMCEGKGKDHPRTGHGDPEGE